MEGLADSSRHETGNPYGMTRDEVLNTKLFNSLPRDYDKLKIDDLLLQVRKKCYNAGVEDALRLIASKIGEIPIFNSFDDERNGMKKIYDEVQGLQVEI